MLSRIKIATSIISILAFLLFLQMLSGGLSFKAQNSSDEALDVVMKLHERKETFELIWSSLLEARISLNRGAQQLLLRGDASELHKKSDAQMQLDSLVAATDKELKNVQRYWDKYISIPPNPRISHAVLAGLERDYNIYLKELMVLLQLLRDGEVTEFIAHPTQGIQDALRNSLIAYDDEISRISSELMTEAGTASRTAFWTILSVMLMTLIIFLLSLVVMKIILVKPMDTLIRSIKEISAGDLVTHIDVHGTNEMGRFASSLRDMQRELATTVGEVRKTADAIFNGVSEIANGNTDLSSRTEQQAASLEETAASMEELTATVKQNAENAQQATNLAANASGAAASGGKAVEDLVHIMNEITDSSKKISEITGVIDGIAFQTNILALNAAVESARAGEHGLGFSVVASEVRSLAQRSAQAAKEIKILIDESVHKINAGSQYADNAGQTMGNVISAVSSVTCIMNEIASASEEQSRGIQQVGIAVVEMDRVTQQNASLVEESAAASAALESQADNLNQAVAVFHISDNDDGIGN